MSALVMHSLTSDLSTIRSSATTEGFESVRVDRVVVLVVLALAVIVVCGLAVAWWMACQAKGLYPTVSIPAWKSGGIWRAYCS
jgi:hypothetical protein